MAWQAYVDNNLTSAGCATSAGIYDLNGNPWAYSPGFAAQVAEVAAISAAMGSDPTSLAGTGVVIAGVKYMFIRGDADCVIGKKGTSGVVVHKCKTCVVVSYHDEKIKSEQCNNVTARLSDYLKDNNF